MVTNNQTEKLEEFFNKSFEELDEIQRKYLIDIFEITLPKKDSEEYYMLKTTLFDNFLPSYFSLKQLKLSNQAIQELCKIIQFCKYKKKIKKLEGVALAEKLVPYFMGIYTGGAQPELAPFAAAAIVAKIGFTHMCKCDDDQVDKE